ncbi:MAG: sigma 54-interacting transcriptional regulator [Candidatus Cloacimonetes bacterium]|nr:sigma 54-interacting transcriptional regulator [Candidatus Cloacimonadota bacterium]
MHDTLNEDLYYEYDSLALNQPRRFLESLPQIRKKRFLPKLALELNIINTCLILGQLSEAKARLDEIYPDIRNEKDSFLLTRYHLLCHKFYALVETETDLASGELEKAEKHQLLSGSISQECEVLIQKCIRSLSEQEISQNEESLQKAMNLAIQCGYQELILDVYLAFIQLYIANNRPEQASQELILIQDMISAEKHPLKYVQMKNLSGVINLGMQILPVACQCFRKALDIAEQQGYVYQQAQLYMNLGIAQFRLKDFEAAIALYRKSLSLLAQNQDLQLSIVHKIISNQAQALALSGKLDESISLMENALEAAVKVGNARNQNILSINLADILIEKREFDYAQRLIETAINYFSQNKLYGMLQNSHLCKARLFEVKGDYKSAFESMEELYGISQIYFRENFNIQSRRYIQRIDDFRNEYLLLKNQCLSDDRLGQNHTNRELLGEHPLIKRALANAMQAARYPYVNVHIYGESGTGKEIVARLIHEASQNSKTLVAINASAISPNLIESELFGHVRGAFTGAISDHKGKFLLANNGTLFLDEISEMPLECQSKLLRAIENQAIIAVGSNKEITVKCRIVSASNKKLKDLVQKNLFRLDLYHRLNKIEIYLPPLRERISDLELLTLHFVKRFAREFGNAIPKIDDSFIECLRKYYFPGNVRELMNIIERIFILKPKPLWTADQLDGLLDDHTASALEGSSVSQTLKHKEQQVIHDILNQTNWVQKEAARLLGMTESTLSRRIKKLGITRQGERK